jgi:hypothetical protein
MMSVFCHWFSRDLKAPKAYVQVDIHTFDDAPRFRPTLIVLVPSFNRFGNILIDIGH